MKKTICFSIILLMILVSMANGQTPVINSMDPGSGPVGTVVTLTGSGFASTGNIIIFQNLITDSYWLVQIQADSPDGKTLQFKVPEFINPGCYYYSSSPCGMVLTKTIPGPYGVILKGATTSTLLKFTVTNSPTPIPVINEISPTSGPIGTVVTITGSEFASTGNVIVFQDALSAAIWKTEIPADSPDGKTLKFKVPEYVNPGCYYSTPPCNSPSVKVQERPYFITVKNASSPKMLLFDVKNTVVTPTPSPAGCILGDVNRDGQVNIIDALLVAQYSVDLPHEIWNPECLDVNHDGLIDIIDALMIARYSVGIPYK